MHIGELATRSKVSISRIRFYERREILSKPSRDTNGYRIYDEHAVSLLSFVNQAQQLGFSLSEIKTGMAESVTTLPSSSTIVTALEKKNAAIDRLIREALEKKQAIIALLEEFACLTA